MSMLITCVIIWISFSILGGAMLVFIHKLELITQVPFLFNGRGRLNKNVSTVLYIYQRSHLEHL